MGMEYCRRCMLTEPEENRILSELAYSRERSIQDLLNQMRYGMHSLKERASESMKERIERGKRELAEYEERLKQHEEDLSYQIMDRALQGENIEELVERITKDKLRQELEQQVKSLKYQPEGLGYEDVEQSLEEYAQQGYIDIERGKIKITPKGARKLANNVLRRILENLTNKEMGPHAIKEIGYGSELSTTSRKYEIGDEYELVDIQRTLLNALERNPEGKRISLKQGDFQVYETQHMTKMCAGLIIDESGSMRVGKEDKINAAIDTSLALSELIKREPKDKLKVFLFSEQVREIPYYDILNISFPGGYTDIRQAMEAFRRCVRDEKGDKQAYLITDTEPNYEYGRYVGFERAVVGVVEEALRYRQDGITLNIIMLDESPQLKRFASALARQNAGRVFFTSPLRLGEVVIEDYLNTRKIHSFR